MTPKKNASDWDSQLDAFFLFYLSLGRRILESIREAIIMNQWFSV